jgi:hypothetical protein
MKQKNCWSRRVLWGPCRIKGESVGLSVYLSIVARQWLGKHVPRQRRIVGGVVFNAVHAVSKERRRSVLPRTSGLFY